MEPTPTRPRSSSVPIRVPSSTPRRCPALLITEEAQDLITSYVASFKRKALPTLAAFALTTRHWTESGQRALFRAPVKSKPTLANAASFLEAIKTKPALASYVRNLDELAFYISALELSMTNKKQSTLRHTSAASSTAYRDHYEAVSSDEDDEPSAPTFTRSLLVKMQRTLLRRCRRVHTASIVIFDEDTATAMASIINCLPQLRNLRLVSTEEFVMDGFDMRALSDALNGTRVFDRLTIDGVEWDVGDVDEEEEEESPFDGMRCRELVLLNVELPWSDYHLKQLLPLHSNLTTFYLTTFSYPESESLVHLLQACGNSLEYFAFKPLQRDVTEMWIDEYGDGHDGVPLLSSFATSLPPTLRRLVLEYCQEMRTTMLLQMAHSAPLLEQIDLDTTIWTPDTDHPVGCPHFEGIVVNIIDLLPKLKHLNLGWLPLSLEDELPLIEDACRQRGIAISWGCCHPGWEGQEARRRPDEEDDDAEDSSDDEEEEMRLRRWRRQRAEAEESDDSQDLWVDDEREGGEGDDVDDDYDLD